MNKKIILYIVLAICIVTIALLVFLISQKQKEITAVQKQQQKLSEEIDSKKQPTVSTDIDELRKQTQDLPAPSAEEIAAQLSQLESLRATVKAQQAVQVPAPAQQQQLDDLRKQIKK